MPLFDGKPIDPYENKTPEENWSSCGAKQKGTYGVPEPPKPFNWGPSSNPPHELTMTEKYFGDLEQKSPSSRHAFSILHSMFIKPATWFHDNVLSKTRTGEEYPYYHRRYRRVPTIDECYYNDMACIYEANVQMQRDKMVEEQLVDLLQQRAADCMWYEAYNKEIDNPKSKCGELKRDYEEAQMNLYIKYGDLRWPTDAQAVLMKQKHRLVWERRHGELPVSEAMKEKKAYHEYLNIDRSSHHEQSPDDHLKK